MGLVEKEFPEPGMDLMTGKIRMTAIVNYTPLPIGSSLHMMKQNGGKNI